MVNQTDTKNDTQPIPNRYLEFSFEGPSPFQIIRDFFLMSAPSWWSGFKVELERYVQEKCPPADSSLIAEAGASATSSSCEAVPEPLNRGEVSQLTKHVRDVIIEACRGGKLLEPFAKKVLGANATAREMRCWKDKAVVAVFYKVSWQFAIV